MQTGTRQVRAERDGPLGLLTLARPAAINAFDLPMVRGLRTVLERWLEDGDVAVVVLRGDGERGFCAGGDIRAVHDGARTDPGSVRALWREEYELDALLGRFPLPVVTLADGITMGGGLGLAGHASTRVVTERSRLAMPEVAIGLSPDAGGLHLLARAPGETGTHMALTASTVGPGDAVGLGLADVAVRSVDLAHLVARLGEEDRRDVLPELAVRDLRTPLLDSRGWVDECYAGGDIVEIHDKLRMHSHPEARLAASMLQRMAPTALAVTLDGIRRARRDDSLERCLVQDFRRSSRFLRRPDLVEGIRAKIVDKDDAPRWQPCSLGEVTAAEVASFCEPLVDDLDLVGTAPTTRRRPKCAARPST